MKHRDDSQMSRFERENLDRSGARDAVLSVLAVVVLLAIVGGDSVGQAANQTGPGFEQDLLAAVGDPAAAVADALPLAQLVDDATGGLSPDRDLGTGGFGEVVDVAGGAGVSPVTPEAFDPVALGAAPTPREPLETLLVTGDSLSIPLDAELAERLAGNDVNVIRDPQLAAAISRPELIDWGALSVTQVDEDRPDAVVVFIGANEFYAMPGPDGERVECCGVGWATTFANRARQMMDTYRQGGAARVYWLTVPIPRDADRRPSQAAVNAAIEVAAQPWRSQVRVIDTVPVFAPDGGYTDSIEVDGANTIVRESDGIHLNEVGAGLAADLVLEAVDRDFTR